MIDSGSDHGGSSRSVVTGSLGGTARFVEVRLVAESDFKVARVLDLPIFRSLWCDSPLASSGGA